MGAGQDIYKSIIFDLDGTLIDSPLSFAAIRDEFKIPASGDILAHLEKLPAELKAEHSRRLTEIEVEAAGQARAFPGVRELLHALRERAVKIGVLTRNCRRATELAIRICELPIDTDAIVTREEARAKPHPEGLWRFLKRWNLEKNELLYVGDFRFDIECGRNAGVKTALFTNGKDVRDFEPKPDYHFSHFDDFWRNLY